MPRPRVLAIVLAGGQGSRMDVLTRERAKPELPFAGTHRLIDIPLSQLHHSRVDDVWVSAQYHATSLEVAVARGRPWDLDRTRGGLRLLGPEEGRSTEHSGFAQGNADGLLKLRHEVREFAPDVLLVMSADHVHRAELDEVVATHLEHEAAATIVTCDLSKTEAVNHGTVGLETHRRGAAVTGFSYKPARSDTSIVATEIFAYDPEILMRVLGQLHEQRGPVAEEGDTGLGDFGEHLIPRLVEEHRVVAHPLPGYWRDVGRPDSYLRAHQDLLAGRTDLFDDPSRPLLGLLSAREPAFVAAGAEIEDAMMSPGSYVEGRVVRSVLGPGVRVAAGATVIDSVLLDDVEVGPGAFVGTSIVDEAVVLGRGARVGVETGPRRLPRDEEISLVGRDSHVAAGVELGPRSRLEPGTRT